MTKMSENSGYHDCPCRDCFEIAIGCDDDGRPSLCFACETAECDRNGECQAPHAYGMACNDPGCCAVHPAGEGYDMHAGEGEWYSACPVCNPV